MQMRIAFAYNVKHTAPDKSVGVEKYLDFDSPEVIESLAEIIAGLGHQVTRLEADEKAFVKLSRLKGQIDLVFNIAEGLSGDARESQIPLFCEILDIPYTHSSPTTHAVKLNKHLCKLVVAGVGVRVPVGAVIAEGEEEAPESIRFPAIIKPNLEGSSVGIFDANVVENSGELENQVAKLRQQGLNGELLVEEYIDGREFTVGVLGNDKLKILPIIEQRFDMLPAGMRQIAGFELKWIYEDKLAKPTDAFVCPAVLDKSLEDEIRKSTTDIYRALQVRDCARLDFRTNQEGELYFLEINTLPAVTPDPEVVSYLPAAARAAGMSISDLVGEIIKLAGARYGLRTD